MKEEAVVVVVHQSVVAERPWVGLVRVDVGVVSVGVVSAMDVDYGGRLHWNLCFHAWSKSHDE
jgi:hypothetical protein